jgi:hypothetical protein
MEWFDRIVAAIVIVCAMLFALHMYLDLRRKRLGLTRRPPAPATAQANHKPATAQINDKPATSELDLTQNDIIVLYMAYRASGGVSESRTSGILLGEKPRGWEARLKRLMNLGLIQTAALSDSKGRKAAILTDEGEAIGRLIDRFSRPLLQLQRTGKLRDEAPADSTRETPPVGSP